MDKDSKSFWTTLPGILAGLASLITALITLFAFFGYGTGNKPEPQLPVESPSIEGSKPQVETAFLDNYTRIPKAGLKGHNIWQLKNVRPEDCARKCMEDPTL